MEPKHIALVAHDNKKDDLLDWCRCHQKELSKNHLFATGTTGTLLAKELNLDVKKMQSGPLGGDQQIGAKISKGHINMLIFFWDPLASQPHDPDVKALLRLAVLWDIPVAMNRSSADYILTSKYMTEIYPQKPPDFSDYKNRMESISIG